MKNLNQIKSSLKEIKLIVVEMQLKKNVITEKEYIGFLSKMSKYLEELEELTKN